MKVYILYCDGFLISRCTAPRLCLLQYSTGDIFFPSVKSLLICCLIFLQKISVFQIFFFNLLWKECLQNLRCPFKKSKMPWCPLEYFGVLLKDNREKIKHFQLLWVHKRLPIIAEFFNWQLFYVHSCWNFTFCDSFWSRQIQFPSVFRIISDCELWKCGPLPHFSPAALLHWIRIFSLINSEFSNYGHFNKRERESIFHLHNGLEPNLNFKLMEWYRAWSKQWRLSTINILCDSEE